jgi:hypothetical protein
MDTGCHAHWLPFFTVEGCFVARKDMIIFLSFDKEKKPVSLTSHRLVLDNASVHGSHCPYT